MEKKIYVQPRIELARLKLEDVMITASPGVEGEYDPNKPIDAKEGILLGEEDEPFGPSVGQELWED